MAQEKSFENKIKTYLSQHGAWYVKYWAGAKFTKEGIPDILACINGIFYAIEIKAPSGRPTVLQLVTLRKIRQAGGMGILLYPDDFDGFIKFLKNPKDRRWYYENINQQDIWFTKLVT